jgi:hypothetical protein
MKKKMSKKHVKQVRDAVKKMKPYVDPLHVPSEKLCVYYKGEVAYMMNKSLLDRQNCWENLDKIKAAHVRKLTVYDLIRETENPAILKKYGEVLKLLEFELQSYWKFPLDANFHRFWEYPKCECPKLDNRDAYPHRQIINLSCPLHGYEIKKSFIQRFKDIGRDLLKDIKLYFENFRLSDEDLYR